MGHQDEPFPVRHWDLQDPQVTVDPVAAGIDRDPPVRDTRDLSPIFSGKVLEGVREKSLAEAPPSF